jgi:ABC-type multidrug transport system ATPase subunit
MAVALANEPKLLLADEPTGELDAKTARQMIELLLRLRRDFGLTILMVTHDPDMAAEADRVLTLRDGALGQDLTTGADSPKLDPEGRLKLPDAVRAQLAGNARIKIEVRPEGILLRQETVEESGAGANQALFDSLPEDAPPESRRRGLFRGKARAGAGKPKEG